MRKLNLGCGPIQPPGWENVDGSMRAWIASRRSWLDCILVGLRIWQPTEFTENTRYANLNKRFPWADSSVDCIFLGEVLEHFTREDGMRLLGECFRVLNAGGVIRVRVPDNERFWRSYLSDYDQNYRKPPAEWTDEH